MFTQTHINQENISNYSKSWFDIVEDEKRNIITDMEKNENYISFSAKEDLSSKEKERDIEIDFFDPTNEEKFDRLVKEEKIKTPLKRRASDQSNISDNSFDDNKNELVTKYKLNSMKRARTTTSSSTSSDQNDKSKIESDPGVLQRRQKQIDYGKNTTGYDNYIASIPKKRRLPEHPKTPPKSKVYSRRAWEGLVREWRKKLHNWDDSNLQKDDKSEDEDDDDT